MSYPVIFNFPQEPAGSCFNWTHFYDIHLPLVIRTYENTSFEKVDLIKFKPGAAFQLTAISWFGEEDFLEVNIDPLWADIVYVTDSTPVVSPGELIDTLYPAEDDDQDGDH